MTTVEQFATRLDEQRANDVLALHRLVTEQAPGLAVELTPNGPAYGRYRYRYATGRTGEHWVVSIRPTAVGVSLYVASVTPDGRYVAEEHADALRPATVGKSCIRIRRVDAVPEEALRAVLRDAARFGGAAAV